MSVYITYYVAGIRGSWNVWKEGQTQPVAHLSSKPAAVAHARALAKRNGARLLIHTLSGTITNDHNYRRRDEARIGSDEIRRLDAQGAK